MKTITTGVSARREINGQIIDEFGEKRELLTGVIEPGDTTLHVTGLLPIKRRFSVEIKGMDTVFCRITQGAQSAPQREYESRMIFEAQKKMHEILPENIPKPLGLIKTAYECAGYYEEFITGSNLSMQAYRFGKASIPEGTFEKVERIVEKLHENEIVFGDIKPENVILAKDGRLVLVDPLPNYGFERESDLSQLEELKQFLRD